MEAVEIGGWGKPVPQGTYRLGDSGANIVTLRNRLMVMNYIVRSVSGVFDEEMLKAVTAFQTDHGLLSDGIVGAGTIEEMNKSCLLYTSDAADE